MKTSSQKLLSLSLSLLLTCSLSSCASGGGGGGDGGGDTASSSSASNFDSASDFDSVLDDILSLVPSEPVSRIINFCGTDEPDQGTASSLAAQFATFVGSGGLLRQSQVSQTSGDARIQTIPTYFHVISKGDGIANGDVPDAWLIEQVNILNRAYSGASGGLTTPFRFELAGINRVRRPEWHVMSPGSDAELDAKQELKIGGIDSLNFYVVDIEPGGGIEGKILGYALLPVFAGFLAPFDGVVLNFQSLPGAGLERYNTGNVAVHETGHWLGLLHTFQGACDGLIDDLVLDTPRELPPGEGEFCPLNRDSCPDREGVDPIHNHMSYTVDSCRFEFTRGQVDFMIFSTTVFRGFFL